MSVVTADAAVVVTPTIGQFGRRSLFWIAISIAILIFAVIGIGINGSTTGGTPLSPTNAAPPGSKALAEVLRQRGVDVISATTLDDAQDALTADSTLLVYDPDLYLGDDKLASLIDGVRDVVLVDPAFTQLQVVAPSIAQAGVVDAPLDAECDLPAAEKAGTVSGDATGFRVIDDDADTVTCFPSGNDVYSLVQLETNSGTLTVLGTTGALTNETIASRGNAALALNLLGANDTLVWYLPSIADLDDAAPPTLGELTPPWVTPALLMLVLAFIAAAIWRGRRLGPLVIENLPVTVRANETMLGRARLYEKGSARMHALDSLRIGAVQRLAGACGLPRVASVDEVIASVASVTGQDPRGIRQLLLDAVPATDAELVRLFDELLRLERAVSVATNPR